MSSRIVARAALHEGRSPPDRPRRQAPNSQTHGIASRTAAEGRGPTHQRIHATPAPKFPSSTPGQEPCGLHLGLPSSVKAGGQHPGLPSSVKATNRVTAWCMTFSRVKVLWGWVVPESRIVADERPSTRPKDFRWPQFLDTTMPFGLPPHPRGFEREGGSSGCQGCQGGRTHVGLGFRQYPPPRFRPEKEGLGSDQKPTKPLKKAKAGNPIPAVGPQNGVGLRQKPRNKAKT